MRRDYSLGTHDAIDAGVAAGIEVGGLLHQGSVRLHV
jgi:hypothetical protein